MPISIPEYEIVNDDLRIHRMSSQGAYKCVKLLPNEEPMGDPEQMKQACLSNPWLLSDIHISSNTKRTRDMIQRFRAQISPDDNIIILGDLSDKHTGSLQLVFDFIVSIPGEKFLILGNNDYYHLSDYQHMGFRYISDEFKFEKDGKTYWLTHVPMPVPNGTINIHGHIHGSGMYWNMSPNGHYDVFVGTDEAPELVRMNDLLNGDIKPKCRQLIK